VRILIAEDDAASRLLLSNVITRLGHEVLAVDNGDEAWSTFQVDHPQVVLTDWMMPGMDGPELCRRIRQAAQFQYTYIIFVTALGERDFYLRGMEAGADDFLTKPFDKEELSVRLTVADRILSLQLEVSQLKGLLPICAYCKKIRDEANAWLPLEEYVGSRTETSFSHALCPECRTEEGGHGDGGNGNGRR
jgi:DNA-binding response OmpR family regulator